MADQESILERLQTLESLPSPPQVAMEIIRVCRDETKGLRDLAQVISVDPAMTSKILKMANSVAYCRGREVTDIVEAASGLGSKTLSIVALGFSLKESVPSWQHESGLSDMALWRSSVATAVASRQLARLVVGTEPESAFLCGLLARIGQQMLFLVAPDEYGEVLKVAAGELPTWQQETSQLGISQHVAGKLLAEKWQLPTLVCETIGRWGDAEGLDDPVLKGSIAVVRTGDAVAQLLFSANKAAGLQRLHRMAQTELQCTTGEVDRLFVSCEAEIRETLEAFSMRNTHEVDCEAILEAARHQLVEVSLRLATDLCDAQHDVQVLADDKQQLERQARTDGLTGLPNRSALDAQLASLSEVRANEEPRPYSIIMVDVDHFKKFNDTWGHAAGDEVLRTMGRTLDDTARSTDFVARYGGEEFTVVLTNAGRENAREIAERYCEAIRGCEVTLEDRTVNVTASLGVASLDDFPPEASYDDVLQAADAALYQAKENGRNRVVCHSPLSVSKVTSSAVD